MSGAAASLVASSSSSCSSSVVPWKSKMLMALLMARAFSSPAWAGEGRAWAKRAGSARVHARWVTHRLGRLKRLRLKSRAGIERGLGTQQALERARDG